MKAIICTGTRISSFSSSISPERAVALCAQYDLVVNELHYIDMEERNLTCVWDVFVPNANQLEAIRGLLAGLGLTVGRRDEEYLELAGKVPTIFFRWHGGDDPLNRPPEAMLITLARLEAGLKRLGFEVTTCTH